MKSIKQFWTLFALCLGLVAALPASAQTQAETPDALIKRISHQVLDAARTDPQIQAGNHRRVMEVVEEHIFPHVDFQRMTALAVGRFWREATPEQQKRLTEEFRTLLVYTYSGAISQARDQRIEFRPFRADPADNEVEVRSQIVQPRGEPVQLNYRLQRTQAGWKIYDVSVLGAWLVESYKNTFASEIGKGGIDGLINTLAERNKRLAASAARGSRS
ncbi:MAG TPA: ABC transporter substrate-binding protein [Noviherbaspirillum sp.]|nr:ABC transporter substrate-binding protein [Noviherbaspirillum sp.]